MLSRPAFHRHFFGIGPGGGLTPLTYDTVEVKVKGHKTASTWVLTQTAIQIAMNKLPIGDHTRGWIAQAAISQSLTSKQVALQIGMYLNPDPGGLPGVLNREVLRIDKVFAEQGGIQPAPPNDAGTRGYFKVDLAVAALKRCSSPPTPPSLGQDPGGPSDPDRDDNTPPDVQIVVGEDIIDFGAYNFSYDQQSSAYTDYHIDTLYTTDLGIVRCPIASGGSLDQNPRSGPTSEFLTLSLPGSDMIVEGTAERVGEKPNLPQSIADNDNAVLLKRHVTMAAPELQGDGQTYVYRASFKYWYGLKIPVDDSTALPLGASPMFTATIDDNIFPAENFIDGIMTQPAGDQGQGDGQGPVGPDGPIGPSQ